MIRCSGNFLEFFNIIYFYRGIFVCGCVGLFRSMPENMSNNIKYEEDLEYEF